MWGLDAYFRVRDETAQLGKGLDGDGLQNVVRTVEMRVDRLRSDSYGSFPSLTHNEEELYAHISGSVPDAPACRVDRELDDDEPLEALHARVISTPGHTDGSIALLFEEGGVLFSGDIATEHEGQVILGPFNHNRSEARESFRRFAAIDVDIVCFGHGQALRGPDTAELRAAATADPVPDRLG